MVKEQYVTSKTANLAKEVKFDGASDKYYYNDSNLIDTRERIKYTQEGLQDYMEDECPHISPDKFTICPTQELLARWIREEYDLSVEVCSTPYGYTWCVCAGHEGVPFVSPGDCDEDNPDTYEASKEIALQKALKLIKRGSVTKYRN